MSGHSKWSQIKRKKGAKDQERGKLFSKLSRAITLAVVEGGGIGDPEKNAKLRLAITQAKTFNMPKDNIARAIQKAAAPEGRNLKEVIYEVFAGPAALMILAATDNPNRTSAEMRVILERYGGKLGSLNSVVHLFDKCGRLVFEKNKTSENQMLDLATALEAGDLSARRGGGFIVYIPFEKLGRVEEICQGAPPSAVEFCWRPKAPLTVDDPAAAQKVLDLVEALENLDDLYQVFTNLNLPED